MRRGKGFSDNIIILCANEEFTTNTQEIETTPSYSPIPQCQSDLKQTKTVNKEVSFSYVLELANILLNDWLEIESNVRKLWFMRIMGAIKIGNKRILDVASIWHEFLKTKILNLIQDEQRL